MAIVVRRLGGRKTLFAAAGLLVVLLLVALAYGAGRDNGSYGSFSSGESSALPYAVPAPSAAPSSGGAAERAVGPTDSAGKAVAGDAAVSGPVVNPDRSLVRTVQLSLDVPDTVAAVDRAKTAVAAAGGYVAQEQTSDRGSTVTLRVPTAALDRTVDDITRLDGATVTSRRSQTSDVTDQVVDLDARVASGQAAVDRVRQLLTKATSMGDVVAIESELAQREGDLDSLKSRLAAVRGQVALSTVTLTVRGPSDPAAPVGCTSGAFLCGLADGWDGLRAVGGAAGAVSGFLLPFAPVVALLVAGIWWTRRTLRARGAQAAKGQGGPGSDGES